MRKKFLMLLFTMVLCMTIISNGTLETRAEEIGEDIDYSYLFTETTLIGDMKNQTWGVYLASGHSIINKSGSNIIGAGGITNAAVKCKVSITSIVERQTSTGWAHVTAWTQTNENAFSAMISKSLTVGTGSYYRVRSVHYAASDVSSSGTGALWMGN